MYAFFPNKSFDQLLDTSPKNFIFLKTLIHIFHILKPSDHAKQSATDAFKTALKKAIQKTAEASGDSIGNFTVKLQKYQETHQRIV